MLEVWTGAGYSGSAVAEGSTGVTSETVGAGPEVAVEASSTVEVVGSVGYSGSTMVGAGSTAEVDEGTGSAADDDEGTGTASEDEGAGAGAGAGAEPAL